MPRKKTEIENPLKGRNPCSKGVKDENIPADKIEEQPQCHIHDKVEDDQVENIRENVCVKEFDYPLIKHTDGKQYCLFHLPTKEKDTEKFEKFFKTRLNSVKEGIAKIKELPKEECEEAKRLLSYDFRYVWFPSVNLMLYEFQVTANFGSATFSSIAFFMSATFSAYTDFSLARFLSLANFRAATFSSDADFTAATFSAYSDFSAATFSSGTDFSSATFSAYADFDSATFLSDAYFGSARFFFIAYFGSATFSANAFFIGTAFSAYVSFSAATFLSDADFSKAKFEETSQIFFDQTSFQGVADFRLAVVKGYLLFEAGEGKVFNGFDDEEMEPYYGKRMTDVFENRLEFANIRAEKPERITFNKVRLRPGWFVNVDSRKFVFTDIAWENYKARKSELEEELKSLTDRRYKEPHNYQLLTVSFRNLAANAEEFNRFEEASNFRKSASECERLERLNRQKKSWREFKSEKGMSIPKLWRFIKTAQFDFVHFLYRWLSYYGENWLRAFGWLWVIWIVFAFGFFLLGEFGTEQNIEYLGFGKSFAYSLFVMTLQKPEPRSLSTITYILYGLETIFAPVQAALLALAIRRKFMR